MLDAFKDNESDTNHDKIAMEPSLRELRRVAGKLHDMNIAMREIQRENEAERLVYQHRFEKRQEERNFHSEWGNFVLDPSAQPLARPLQEEELEAAECERVKVEASIACQRISKRYDSLIKFIKSCPRGNYEEFIEFLLMGGGRAENDTGGQIQDEYTNFLFEDFYSEMSDYRKLWNDNLTLGLLHSTFVQESRTFIPAETRRKSPTSIGVRDLDSWRIFSENERLKSFRQSRRNKIAQIDTAMIKQGVSSAVDAISNVSSFVFKPLIELQLAEKLNALATEEAEQCRKLQDEQYEEQREAEELIRLKNEAIETCLNATTEHLLNFIKVHPSANYHEWIEDLHPENAHEGTLIEGLGKTIDHRFFVEVSDHRRIWNENLFTFLGPDCLKGRDFVPARCRHNDELVVAADILSGSENEWKEISHRRNRERLEIGDSDLIQFE